MPSATERSILTGPNALAKTAAYATAEPEQRWMLRQPREVRRSFADEVFGRPDATERQEIWMLRQPKAVRESFIRDVLELEDPPLDIRGHSLAELLRPAYPAMSDAARQRITGP